MYSCRPCTCILLNWPPGAKVLAMLEGLADERANNESNGNNKNTYVLTDVFVLMHTDAGV